ncbi:protein artichoke-like [Venturia canescens]|uniref:protein artichoke-like n=1 Tax=Venturia canescens TaxID=32260 RepID=UPI001C9BCAB6|nr:protein artichoke-like [Venturia canescens]
MLILGYLLIPVVLAAPSEVTRNGYTPKIENGELRSIEIIGEPPRTLDLSGLGFQYIDDNVFKNLSKVKSINLANNSISSISRAIFSDLVELEHLSLADNAISSLQYGQFYNLRNLKFLNISNNPINELDSGHLYGLGKWTNVSARIIGGLWMLESRVFDDISNLEDEYVTWECPVEGEWDGGFERNQQEIVCIREGIVEKLELFKPQDVVEPHCKLVKIVGDTFLLSLSNFGISGFVDRWYRLDSGIINGLDLHNNSLMTVEFLNNLPADITDFDLTNNRIGSLRKGSIRNERVKSLILTNNSISEIEDGALEGTQLSSLDLSKNRLNNTRFVATLPASLKSLQLSENCIAELSPSDYSRFRQLDKIDFTGNDITVIKKSVLRGLGSLTSLSFVRNKIENIETDAFRDLISLKQLNLAENKLTKLDKGVFDGLRSLEELDLSWNDIKKITHDSFHGLPKVLSKVFLSFNQLEFLESGTFFERAIEELHLNGNKLKTIEEGTFNSSVIYSLYLQNNSFSQISGNEFSGSFYLHKLNLANNRISKIEKGFASNLDLVFDLNLSNNPFTRLENGALFGISKGYEVPIYPPGNNSHSSHNTVPERENEPPIIPDLFGSTSVYNNPVVFSRPSNKANSTQNISVKRYGCRIRLHNVELELLQGGVFEDL